MADDDGHVPPPHPAGTLPATGTRRDDIYNARLRVNRLASIMILVFSGCLLLSRGFPVVATTESCGSDLLTPQLVLLCGIHLNGSFTTDYSIFNVSSTYDPWPGFTASALAPNGRSILLFFGTIFAVIWAVTARRRARELPTFWHRRAKRRRLRLEAGLIVALVGTALLVNILQIPRFDAEWTSQTCGRAGWCSATPQWGLYVLIGIAICLMAAIVIAAWSLETDQPSPSELRAVIPGAAAR